MTRVQPTSSAETDLTIGNLARVGVIESVDLAAGKAVVRFGDELTPPIDWMMSAGDTRIWMPPTKGEQVQVLACEGDIEQAVILGGLPSSISAPLFLGATVAIQFKDGAVIKYDPESHRLHFDLPGSAVITAPSGAVLDCDVEIQGDLKVTGAITADGDVKAGDISVKNHLHGGVSAGQGVSGKPRP
nr:phage baseplate assembly protein V [uncultured Brevundimonas sp.]